ncbi:MAG: MFS transporter [Chloroflexota bacterium]|nr:MFS transporter [Chloroflexota bacterium]
MVSPALPELKSFFHLAGSIEEIVVATFMIGYAIGSLFYGPLANSYGRKKALYIGLGIHLLGLLFSNLSYPFESLSLLLIGRFFSSFGSSAGMVIGIILIRDIFEGDQVHKMMSYAVISPPVAMGVSMTIGGFLTESLAWVSCFQVQFGYGILVFVLATRLKETLSRVDPGATKIKNILHGLKECFLSKRLIGFSIVGGVIKSLNYLFASASPIISEDFFNLAPQKYGL